VAAEQSDGGVVVEVYVLVFVGFVEVGEGVAADVAFIDTQGRGLH